MAAVQAMARWRSLAAVDIANLAWAFAKVQEAKGSACAHANSVTLSCWTNPTPSNEKAGCTPDHILRRQTPLTGYGRESYEMRLQMEADKHLATSRIGQ